MRLFIAANIPEATRDAIYADAAPLRAATHAVRWVAAPSLHVTLKFLGERDEAVVADFENAVRMVAARHQPVEVTTTELGAFPNFRHPRVVWVGMTGETALRAIARDIDLMVAGLGVAGESREFRAHLTLGRVKGEMSSPDATALAAAAQARPPARGFAIRTIDLMRSELGPGGSRYSVLAAVPLHARGT
jgi:RNA 2',3'-cyclic 3'-phosphodiesterase